MKTVLNFLGRLASFDFVEKFFLKKLSTGSAASLVATIAGLIVKYGLSQYGIAIDPDSHMISVSVDALLTGGALALFNAMKHAGENDK